MKTLLASIRMKLVLTLLTGLLYPLAVWAFGQLAFRDRAEGSLVVRDGHVVGSELLAQKTTDPRYFQPRPSAADYATVASGASNQAWTNASLVTAIDERRAAHGGGEVPAELLTTSGSGLDPHLSPAGVHVQLERVAAARALDPAHRRVLEETIARLTEGGALSPERVNVLCLNLELDAMMR
jgi:potassium-transporting ATPase KdpC subunit